MDQWVKDTKGPEVISGPIVSDCSYKFLNKYPIPKVRYMVTQPIIAANISFQLNSLSNISLITLMTNTISVDIVVASMNIGRVNSHSCRTITIDNTAQIHAPAKK